MSQNFAFHGAPPVRIATTHGPVAEAQAALDAWEATCPGSPLEVFGNLKRERLRIAWLYKKDQLQGLLRMAQEAEKTGWKDAQGNRVAITIPKRRTDPTTNQKAIGINKANPMKTAAEYIAKVEACIEAMAKHVPGSAEWFTIRKQASHALWMAKARADSGGFEPLLFPELPKVPPELSRCGKTGRKSPEQMIETMVQRMNRYAMDGKRRHVSTLRSKIRGLCRETGIELPAEAS